jgi:hypothetical protein
MTETGDRGPLPSKCKAITTLFPYTVWQERGGESEMFDTVLDAVKAAKLSGSIWKYISPDLIQHLDHVLGQMAMQPEPPGKSYAVDEGPIQKA